MADQPCQFLLNNVSRGKDYYSWLQSIWITILDESENVGQWMFASTPVIYQLRSEHMECDGTLQCIPEIFGNISNWNETVHSSNISHSNYYYSWIYRTVNFSNALILGNISFFSSDGYKWILPVLHTIQTNRTILDMSNYGWLDSKTSMLKHEFLFYEPILNKYAYVNLLLEQKLYGYIVSTIDFKLFSIELLHQNIDYFCLACIILLILLSIYLFFHLIMKFRHKGFTMLKSFWCLHMVLISLTSAVLNAMLIYRIFMWDEFSDTLVNGHLPDGINLSKYILYENISLHLCGILSFLIITRVRSYIFPFFQLIILCFITLVI